MLAVFTLMQRCIFFIVFALTLHFAKAQTVDVYAYQVDVTISDLMLQTLNAQVEIELRTTGYDSIKLSCGKHLQINSVAWREGRIKGYLSFRQTKSAIYIALPQNRNSSKTVLSIQYVIDLTEADVQAYITQNPSLLAINPSGMFNGASLGYAGLLFPAIADDAALIHTNFGHSPAYKTGTVGNISFYTTRKEEKVGTFWDGEKPINPATYFIAVGSFDEFEPQELDKEYGFRKLSSGQLVAKKTERILGSALPFIKTWFGKSLTDSDLNSIDSISILPLPNFLITEADFYSNKDYDLKKASFLWAANLNAITANEAFTQYYKSEQGEEAFKRLLNEKWQAANQQPSFALLTMYKQLYMEENTLFADSIKQQFVNAIDTGNLPIVSVRYKYLGGLQQQVVFVSQDTSQTTTFSFPLQLWMVAKDSVLPMQTSLVSAQPLDTLAFTLTSTPQSVSINFGAYFPGYVIDEKPDYYALYDLSNAKSYAQRAQALEQLFNTQNVNLYSTVVGIALRDDDPAIRQKALNAVQKLNTVGAFKIKDTLLQLKTSEPAPELRKQAASLYLKLYGEQ